MALPCHARPQKRASLGTGRFKTALSRVSSGRPVHCREACALDCLVICKRKRLSQAFRLVTPSVVPDGVTSIGKWAFLNCDSLVSIALPEGLISIGNYAFVGATSLASASFPDSLTSIGYAAFRGATSLASVSLPDSLTSIGDTAFYLCSSLPMVYVPPRLLRRRFGVQ